MCKILANANDPVPERESSSPGAYSSNAMGTRLPGRVSEFRFAVSSRHSSLVPITLQTVTRISAVKHSRIVFNHDVLCGTGSMIG